MTEHFHASVAAYPPAKYWTDATEPPADTASDLDALLAAGSESTAPSTDGPSARRAAIGAAVALLDAVLLAMLLFATRMPLTSRLAAAVAVIAGSCLVLVYAARS